MSFMGTLAKVAIGYAAARGVDKLAGDQGLAGLLGGGAEGGGLEGLLGGAAGDGTPGGGLQDLLGGLTGGTTGTGETGGLGGIFDSLSSGAGGDGDGGTLGLAGIVGAMGLAGGAAAATTSLGDILSGHVDDGKPDPAQEDTAKLLLRTMIQAAKSDGGIDMQEKQRILDTVGDASPGEIAFVTEQMQAPLDPEALAADTPAGQGEQVYSTALMTIKLDQPAEAQFLSRLGHALGLPPARRDALHRQMGAPTLSS